MDTRQLDIYEAARVKYARNFRNNEKYKTKLMAQDSEVTLSPIPVQTVQVPALLVPKEKPQEHGIIECIVSLPDKEVRVRLQKRNIYSHISSVKLSEDNVRKALIEGFKGLLGEIG